MGINNLFSDFMKNQLSIAVRGANSATHSQSFFWAVFQPQRLKLLTCWSQ
jgi:hypothetical protein